MHDYLKEHYDERLCVRIFIYEMLGQDDAFDYNSIRPQIRNAIKMAGLLEDDQLLSELYSFYGEHGYSGSERLLYTLKAIEMQEKIGAQYFPFLYARYETAAHALGGTRDYK